MQRKIVGILVMTLLIVATILPVTGTMNIIYNQEEEKSEINMVKEAKQDGLFDSNQVKEYSNIMGKSGIINNCQRYPTQFNINNGRSYSCFFQRPYEWYEDGNYYTSSSDAGYLCQDDFWGLEDPISEIYWFGESLYWTGSGWTSCDPLDMKFNVIFYEDNAGVPGDIVCEYLNIEPSYLKWYFPPGNIEYYWYYLLEPYCDLSEGWVSIQSIYSSIGCWFLWTGSPDNDPNALQNGVPIDDSLAFQLNGGVSIFGSGPGYKPPGIPQDWKTECLRVRIGDPHGPPAKDKFYWIYWDGLVDPYDPYPPDESWMFKYISDNFFHIGLISPVHTLTAKPDQTDIEERFWSDGMHWKIDWNGDGETDERWIWEEKMPVSTKWYILKSREVYRIIEDPNPVFDGDEVYFWGGFYGLDSPANYSLEWDFGDGTDPVAADCIPSANNTYFVLPVTHIYESPGTYNAKLTNTILNRGFGLDTLEVVVTQGDNHAPSTPDITGPTSGKAGENYTYSFVSTDSDGDEITYFVDWGDYNCSILGPSPSNEEVSSNHAWSEKGSYTIRVLAQDPPYYFESDWAELVVTMPRNRAINGFFLRFLEQFPILSRLLYLIEWDF